MEKIRCYRLIIALSILVLFALIVPIHAANISGLKYNDFNQNGIYDPVIDVDPDDQEIGIPGWNISVILLEWDIYRNLPSDEQPG